MTELPNFDIRTSKLMSPEWCRANGFLPYEVRTQRTDDGQRNVAYVVRRAASSGDFAVSKAKLEFFANKATLPSFVVLTERDSAHVLTVQVGEMVRRLAGVTPKPGNYGPYYWVSQDGYPNQGGSTAGD